MLPYKLGDNGPEILAWQEWFNRAYRSYAPPVDGYYGNADADATRELQRRLGLLVTGEFTTATAEKSGYRPAQAPPPAPPRQRHLAVVYRGTGGIIGQDYVSRVCQGAADLVEERNPAWAATMGGLPVGVAGGPDDPSMDRAVQAGLAAGQAEIAAALRVNPRRGVVIGGYSAGAVVAALLRQWLLDNHPQNYVCSFSFGDPTRPEGGAYYLGAPAPGRGIGSWRYGDINDPRHCWLAAPGDMYTSVPVGSVGDIMSDAYDMITNVELSDPLTTARAIIDKIPVIMDRAGVSLPGIFGALAGGAAGIGGWWTDVLTKTLRSLITAGGDPTKLTGPAAAAQAAIIALQFVGATPPTAAHIQYDVREVWPGQTYLGLAIQHVRDWSTRARTEAA